MIVQVDSIVDIVTGCLNILPTELVSTYFHIASLLILAFLAVAFLAENT